MEFLPVSRRRSSARNVPSGEERGEMFLQASVFPTYEKFAYYKERAINGSNFRWLIQKMSVNQKSGRQTFLRPGSDAEHFMSPT